MRAGLVVSAGRAAGGRGSVRVVDARRDDSDPLWCTTWWSRSGNDAQ